MQVPFRREESEKNGPHPQRNSDRVAKCTLGLARVAKRNTHRARESRRRGGYAARERASLRGPELADTGFMNQTSMRSKGLSRVPLASNAYRQSEEHRRILLAEDDVDLRELFERALEEEGYSVLCAANGREALAAFSSSSIGALPPPSCIVLDIRMPEYSGLELLLALQLAEWKIPVILVTGFGNRETHERALHYGCFAILDKPLHPDLLVSKVKEAIEAYRSSPESEPKRPLPMSFFGT